MGPPASHRVSRVRWYSGVTPAGLHFEYGAFTLSRLPSQVILLYKRRPLSDPQPQLQAAGLDSFPFARRYSENRGFFLFLQVLRCFSSLSYLLLSYLIQTGIPAHYCWWVAPFGNLRIDVYLLLPAAYRSLSRPSSAPSAKAFTLCSFSLIQ